MTRSFLLLALCIALLFVGKTHRGPTEDSLGEITAGEDRWKRWDSSLSDVDTYTPSLQKFQELRSHILPAPALAPNTFLSNLRDAVVSVRERARGCNVGLPSGFYLGFDEFAVTLPGADRAHWLGQELEQVELLVDILIDVRVDAITSVKRKNTHPNFGGALGTVAIGTPLRPVIRASSSSVLVEPNIVEIAFVANPKTVDEALRHIVSADQQLYLIRELHLQRAKNQQLSNKRLEVAATIEMLRLSL